MVFLMKSTKISFSACAKSLTFDLTVVKGAGSFPLSAQASPTGEAQSAPQVGLVRALRARLTRFETIAGERSGRTLA